MTTNQKFNCIFCKDVFDNKEELQEHFRKHGDPKFKNRSENDSQTCDKSKEKVEMVSCDVCSQVFPTISKAITHKHKVHPDHDAKYFCPWCGKLFTMKHLYNIHVQSSHSSDEKAEDKGFHCDSCNVDFFLPSAMINHNKFFHRQDTDLPDVGHSKKIKFYNQDVIPIYYCAFCGEEYENKVNLIKHISDDHEDENQSPDEVLKCPLCNAVFYHLDAYEIHLTFHSSEDMFSDRNDEFNDLLDYSLETIPPIIEKVENLDTQDQNQDTDAESTLNAVGIEKFLELAMDQSDDSNPVKVKKHKKHKKSKKSAITLDEFLNMNKDVFGEGLDFHGIEEVPTRVVKKQLKNNKKATDAAVTSAELEKLKKAGIVVKRKVGRIPMVKSVKVGNSKPIRNAQNKSLNKFNPDKEIKTSSEVLSKLINQSNNQIKIVKKTTINATSEPKPITNNDKCETAHTNTSANYVKEFDQTKITSIPESEISMSQSITKPSSSPKPEEPSVSATADTSLSNTISENDIKSDANEVSKTTLNRIENMLQISVVPDIDHSSTPGSNKIDEGVPRTCGEGIDKNELDQISSDLEFLKQRENYSDTDNETLQKQVDEIQASNDGNSNHINLIGPKVGALSPLKHLSHLITVKSVSQNKNKSVEPTNYLIHETTDGQNPQNNKKRETSNLLTSVNKVCLNKPKLVDKDPTMDALKTLSKNITIKSLSTKNYTDENEPEGSEIDDVRKPISVQSQDMHSNRNMNVQKNKVEMSEGKINHSLDSQSKKNNLGKPSITQPAVGKRPTKIIVNTDNSLPTSNANILKRLTNITTKPIIKKNNDLASMVQQTQTNVQAEEKKEEIIEIFDIDDSEDETESDSKKPEPNQNSINSMDALKNLSKNITVKSLNQPSHQKNIKVENNIKIEKEENKSPSCPRFTSNSTVDAHPNLQNRNVTFTNVLQGPCKNITIKSRNSTPSQFFKSEKYKQDSKLLEDGEDTASDSDSCPGNVKITELDDEMGDNEDNSESKLDPYIGNPIVESPNESCSDNEEINDNDRDFETEIQYSTVQKCNQNMTSTINSVCLNNLKNINKNITIKSISKTTADKEDTNKQAQLHENLETQHQQKNQLQIKPSKPIMKEPQIENNISTNKKLQIPGQMVDHTLAQSSNKKISTINQVNSTNKEVTVKTFQTKTKTVIQEITTTVTKTIKTVNQTMKQEVRNTYQANAPMVTQRAQAMRPNQQKNLQGVVIRHASPTIAHKQTNVVPQIRPTSNVVRPSKQIVPMRPSVPRPTNPRMAVGKKVTPTPSPNKQILEKSLKISPGAMTAPNTKRTNTENVSGPFSCFKKPKESLIPVSDVPPFTSVAGEANVQYAASHTSSSNFTSTTKVMKGKAVLTAKQIKSQVSTSSQQLSRLSNTTMTNQGKETEQQEKSENSAIKRTTLEAIERLQKQGLLVKKPRMDVNESVEASGDSDHDGDDNLAYSSTENDE